MAENYLLSTLVMGLVLVAVAVAVARAGRRAAPTDYADGPSGYAAWSGRGESESRRSAGLANESAVRAAAVVVLVVLFAALAWFVLT